MDLLIWSSIIKNSEILRKSNKYDAILVQKNASDKSDCTTNL